MSKASYFITTSIPYVNSTPHVGHAQEFVLADSLARFYRLKDASVFLQSGSDDNSTKNVLAAKSAGVPVQVFVDEHAKKFQALLQNLQIQPDLFIRTSGSEHARRVQDFLQRLSPNDVYVSQYEGLYCTGCEDFFRKEDLQEGLCPDHRKAPEILQEENLFFRLSSYRDRLIDLIQSDRLQITPAWRKPEILAFAENLKDISLSRSSVRTQGWGIPYPHHPAQTVYVWIDALVNYLAAGPKWWNESTYKIHVVGKNVWKFHALYWPALLLSAGLPLPNEILIHGFLTTDGIKISKSLGNGIDPFKIIRQYGDDAFRFYLLSTLGWEQDADFVEQGLVTSFNSELANKWGNLVSRLWALRKLQPCPLPVWPSLPPEQTFSGLSTKAFAIIHKLNQEIHEKKPWELARAEDREQLQNWLKTWFQQLAEAASFLLPLLPEGSTKLAGAWQNPENLLGPLYPRI